MKYILATVDTASFEWAALGDSPQACNVALCNAYSGHCAKTPDADPMLMWELITAGEVNYAEFQESASGGFIALRDGSPVPDSWRD